MFSGLPLGHAFNAGHHGTIEHGLGLLDELDVIECFREPGKAPIQGEVLKKQEQIYRDLGVEPLLAAPEMK